MITGSVQINKGYYFIVFICIMNMEKGNPNGILLA